MTEYKCEIAVIPVSPIAQEFWNVFERELRKVLTDPVFSWDITNLNYTTLISYCSSKWPKEYENLYESVIVYETNKGSYCSTSVLAHHVNIYYKRYDKSYTLELTLVVIPKLQY